MIWEYAEHKEIGRSHEASDNPVCQDQCKYMDNGKKQKVYAIALADGAGSAPYSEYGAKIAVETICKYLCGSFKCVYEMSRSKHNYDLNELKNKIKEELQASIRKEAEKIAKEKQEEPDIANFASTLLFVALSGNRYIMGHIGDGFIAALYDNKEVEAFSMPKNGSYSNETYFVTDAQMEEHFEIMHGNIKDKKICAFALMSDGTAFGIWDNKANKFVPALSMIMDTACENRDLAQQYVKKLLMQIKNTKTSDDCSMIILAGSKKKIKK